MSKKIGKFLLATAGLATAAAAAYYYLQKKDIMSSINKEEEEDLDNFSEDLDDTASRSYVQLNREESATNVDPQPQDDTDSQPTEATTEGALVSETAAEVEEFFDEEDMQEPSVGDE